MSTNSKGAEYEREAMKVLAGEGFTRIHRTVRTPIMNYRTGGVLGSHSNDVFNAFDLVASSRAHGIIWLQVTDTTSVAKRQKKVVSEVGEHFRPEDDERVEVWGWVGGAKKRDARFPKRKVFLRRQYFRRTRFDWSTRTWTDITPPDAGWVDGGERP